MTTISSELLDQAVESGKLDLTGMGLRSIPDSVLDIKSLSELNLRNNPLLEIPSSLSRMVDLKKLDLTECGLSQLPAALGELKTLKMLNLQSNPLGELPECVYKLKSLSELFLSNCSLTHLPNEVGNLKKLKILWMSGNQLRDLPDSLFSLPKLEKFFCRNNQLTSLGPSVWRLPRLKEFNANGNPLAGFPSGLTNPEELPNLRTVGLADCNLAKIPDGFLAHEGLEKMVLENNPIPLPERVLAMGDSYPYEINIRGFRSYVLGLNPKHPARDTEETEEAWGERPIWVSRRAYQSDSKYDAIAEVVDSVGRNLLEGNAVESIPKIHFELFIVHEFRYQLSDAGLGRFLSHYGWSKVIQERLLQGFLKIGAVRYWHFVRELQALLGKCSEAEIVGIAEQVELSNSKLQKERERLDVKFFRMIDQEDSTEIHQQWCRENHVFAPRCS